jgi:hypothetical protein
MTREIIITEKDKTLYPEKLIEKEKALLKKFEEEKKHPNIRTRLMLIAEGFALLAEKEAIEAAIKAKTMGNFMKVRIDKKRLTDGNG